MRRAAVGWVLGLAAVVAAGCAGSLERPALRKTRFVLGLPAPAVSAARAGGVLWLDRVRVSPLFDHKGFVQRTGADTYESDVEYEWFAPPGAVLREAMLDWLEGAALFASIERSSVSASDWLLETDVDRLYADRRDPGASAAVLAGRFRLVDLRGPRPARVLERRFDEREPAGDGTAQALVDAWGRALARALDGLAPDLAGAVAGPTTRTR